MFHAVLATTADEIVGSTQHSSELYQLVYRSIHHRRLREICEAVQKATLNAKLAKYVAGGGFGSHLQSLASAVLELQQKRHSADYDPRFRVRMLDAAVAIATARSGIARLYEAPAAERRAFSFLLAFEPR